MPRMSIAWCLDENHDDACKHRPNRIWSFLSCNCPCHWDQKKIEREIAWVERALYHAAKFKSH